MSKRRQVQVTRNSQNGSADRVVTRFKGGSLSSTSLMARGDEQFVRKTISLTTDREYGYIRWHSQLKRLQRFGQLFPDVFPAVLRYGLDGESAYFDLEYVEGAISGFDFVAANPSDDEVNRYFDALMTTADRLHKNRRPSCTEALQLYVFEEMERPLAVCRADPLFEDFSRYDRIVFNGVEIPSILGRMEDAYEIAGDYFKDPWECYTHGNLTLENTLWVPRDGRVWFVDPYEENVIDTVHNEYSQLLQSCNSYYEVYNARAAVVAGNEVTLAKPDMPAMEHFNDRLWARLRHQMTDDDLVIVRLYEVSQFTRMLPFKLHVAKDKMIFFYALASYLFDRLVTETGRDGDACP